MKKLLLSAALVALSSASWANGAPQHLRLPWGVVYTYEVVDPNGMNPYVEYSITYGAHELVYDQYGMYMYGLAVAQQANSAIGACFLGGPSSFHPALCCQMGIDNNCPGQ